MNARLDKAITLLDAELARAKVDSGVKLSIDLATALQKHGLLVPKVADFSPFWVGQIPSYRERYVLVEPEFDNFDFQVAGRTLTRMD